MEKKEIKIFRAGRESLEEAVRLVQSTEEKMKEKSWFVAESLEEFDRWMRKDQGWLYVAKDCSSGQLAGMFFVVLPGMEEENLQLEPSISRQEIKIGDRFLLCSDGITDMLSDGEIADILSRDTPVAKTVEILVDRALKKGGRDNITVVLCEIMEQPRNMFRRVLNWFHRQNEGDI